MKITFLSMKLFVYSLRCKNLNKSSTLLNLSDSLTKKIKIILLTTLKKPYLNKEVTYQFV